MMERLWRLLEAKFLVDTARQLLLRAMHHLADMHGNVDRAFYSLSAAVKHANEAYTVLEDEVAALTPRRIPWRSTREVVEGVVERADNDDNG